VRILQRPSSFTQYWRFFTTCDRPFERSACSKFTTTEVAFPGIAEMLGFTESTRLRANGTVRHTSGVVSATVIRRGRSEGGVESQHCVNIFKALR
jgi:hypothetical protein